VDGTLLPKLNATEFNSMPMGWQADPTGNRLPSAQVPLLTPRREIKVDFRTH
jgi:hypothetical protein